MGLVLAATLCGSEAGAGPVAVRGLPFTRSYPLEELGYAPRGVQLDFDRFGRLAAIHRNVYSVLNDTVWLDLAEKGEDVETTMLSVARGADGRSYYGARGSWGVAAPTANGRLAAEALVDEDPPKWVLNTSFNDIVATRNGVYFAGWNGIVYWEAETRRNHYFPINSVGRIFRVGERVFVSAHTRPLHVIDESSGTLRPVPSERLDGAAVESAAPLDETRALISAGEGRLMVFDGERLTDWPETARHGLSGRANVLERLVDGGIALAIAGRGVFLISPEGELMCGLTTPAYHRVTDLASNEAGVLWVAGEDAIVKVLYGSPLTQFGQQLGLPVSWPTVLRWGDRLLVASGGQLFEAVPGAPGLPNRFERMDPQIQAGAWAVAARGSHLLVGNVRGIFSVGEDGGFTPVALTSDVARLVMVGPDLCFAIGRNEVGVLRLREGRWAEAAARIGGIGDPLVVHASQHAVWIETGGNRVGRLSLKADGLDLRTFDDLPWEETQWVNVGVVDDTVILSGPVGGRVYFDERSERRCEAPELERLLARSPYWITRVDKDETGTLWGTHSRGVVTFTPDGAGYVIDSSTFDLVNDHHPFVSILPGNDVWITAARSLLHVERHDRMAAAAAPLPPVLVSVGDRQIDARLLAGERRVPEAFELPFARNSLNLRFFSGGYAWRRAPGYQFRLNDAGQWRGFDPGSALTFPGLAEGDYRLEVRVTGTPGAANPPAVLKFKIHPPWHRTPQAYAAYGMVLLLGLVGVVRWTGYRTRRRNLALEALVSKRTGELQATMEKLNEETRHAATLAERDRLAGEIHDSLQQGLSGLMLQLDATLKLPTVSGDVRSRLNVARNMVSFTRHEVQHAVWDMETPLLEDTELSDALRKLTHLLSSGAAQLEIAVAGTSRPLPSATQHHLLRIAQEAITNAVRHAAARRIVVGLDYSATALSLSVVDDGVGFPATEVMTRSIGHFGLRGLRGRAIKIGAELSIDSEPGRGTTIRVTVPLKDADSLSPDANHRTP